MKNILKLGYSAFTILLALPVYAQTDTPPSFSGDGGLGEVEEAGVGVLIVGGCGGGGCGGEGATAHQADEVSAFHGGS